MRVGAIDVGTNSVHLLVADVAPDGEVSVVEKAREQVELGRGGLDSNRITDDAMERGISAIVSFKEACDSLGVEAINATATSAVREASNGADFCKQVRERCGVHVRVISGTDEARLIWLGARADLDLSRGYALLLDLGGGSAELILCDSSRILASHSLPLGHIRMSEAYLHDDPPTWQQLRDVRDQTKHVLRTTLRDIRPGHFGTFVCTSGALRTLGRMVTLARGLPEPVHDHGLVIPRGDLKKLMKQFTELKASKLSDLPGMDTRRKHTLPAAAAVLYQTMKVLERDEVVTSERSLRDGLLQDWVVRNEPELALSGTVAWPRMRSVLRMLDRFEVDRVHSEHVRDLALSLFDGLEEIHGLGADTRRMLEFAALLHDIGHHIAARSHNKHGQYLILNSRLPGFTAPEVAVLANLVRYHRGARPKRKHRHFASLSRTNKKKVQLLAGILRLADGLDRSHNQPVRTVEVEVDKDHVHVVAVAARQAHLERWAAERRRRVLAQALGREVRITLSVADDEASLRPDSAHQVQ